MGYVSCTCSAHHNLCSLFVVSTNPTKKGRQLGSSAAAASSSSAAAAAAQTGIRLFETFETIIKASTCINYILFSGHRSKSPSSCLCYVAVAAPVEAPAGGDFV